MDCLLIFNNDFSDELSNEVHMICMGIVQGPSTPRLILWGKWKSDQGGAQHLNNLTVIVELPFKDKIQKQTCDQC